MKVQIRHNATGAIMIGKTRLSPEQFAIQFARGFDTEQFSYRIIQMHIGRHGQRITRSFGITPAEAAIMRAAA